MFTERSLPTDLDEIRERHAPDALVLDVDQDFETLPPAVAEELGLFVDRLDPVSYPAEWLPDDAPSPLERLASATLTVGMPGDGTVVTTRQTDPPTVLVKKRAEGTPDDFLDHLIADGLVRLDVDAPEHALGFFGADYRRLDAAVRGDGDGSPADTYQVAVALFDAWLGLHTRPVVSAWDETFPRLDAAWVDAGERLTDRLDDLTGAVARGETTFPAATEYACNAVRHGLDLPTPFSALDTAAYHDHGPEYAVEWAERTYAAL
ncbi:MAG: hypothetical protein ABEJ43_06240 [Haloferacaceae archaeon]